MGDGNIVTQVFLPLSLAFIMFSLGLALVVDDFKRVVVQPKAFFIGALGQMVMLPVLGFVLASAWPMDPALKVGVMILAACPSGATSNLLTHLSKGDTALAVSLTATVSVASVFTMPVIVGFAIAHFMATGTGPEISVIQTIIGVFIVTNVPVALGMAIRHWAPQTALKAERVARHVAAALFVLIVLGAVYSERANIGSYFAQAGVAMLALNVAVMAGAWLLARGSGLDRRQRIAVVIECGLQNGTLAIFVAATLLQNTAMMVPGGIYSLIMFATAGLFLALVLKTRAGV
jgi:BASS family bile acid:Na+ symporter